MILAIWVASGNTPSKGSQKVLLTFLRIFEDSRGLPKVVLD